MSSPAHRCVPQVRRLEPDRAAPAGRRRARDTPGPPVKAQRARTGGHRLVGAPDSNPSAIDRPGPGAEVSWVSSELRVLGWVDREDLKPPLPRKSHRKKEGRDSSH